jgi:hypothetical protein
VLQGEGPEFKPQYQRKKNLALHNNSVIIIYENLLHILWMTGGKELEVSKCKVIIRKGKCKLLWFLSVYLYTCIKWSHSKLQICTVKILKIILKHGLFTSIINYINEGFHYIFIHDYNRLWSYLPPPCSSSSHHILTSSSFYFHVLLSPVPHMRENICYLSFWFISFSMTISSSIYFPDNNIISYFFIAKYNSIVNIYHISLFFHLLTGT